MPAAGRARATGSRDSADVRATGFLLEQSRPTSALCLGLGLGVTVNTEHRPPGCQPEPEHLGSPHGPKPPLEHGPNALRWLPRGDGASRSVDLGRGGTFLVAGEGCPGCPGPGALPGLPDEAGSGSARAAQSSLAQHAAVLGRHPPSKLQGASDRSSWVRLIIRTQAENAAACCAVGGDATATATQPEGPRGPGERPRCDGRGPRLGTMTSESPTD